MCVCFRLHYVGEVISSVSYPALSQPAVFGSPIGRRTIGQVSSGFGRCRTSLDGSPCPKRGIRWATSRCLLCSMGVRWNLWSESTPVCHRTLESGEAEFQTKRRTLKCPEERQVEDIGPKDKEGVRRRVKTQEVPDQSDNNDPWTETEPATSSKPEPNPQQDPLKWFGILVPQTLKQAQASFKQVVELSAEMAALQSAVLTTRQQLQMKQKSRSQNSDQTDRLT
ncbi:coiled-coil domain-containing protein 115 isoform X2 [Salvelinus fontinalis]|uniref:coiled-coil domain-containing protein 115 isoform X2 n=1 Tax=Salvelinus fontinalis TaxID=8038 RepID=UPI0024855C3C|nr:coiled-coil domain-containing protein 115 isoform X2 [Salvelinus fontinalis]